MHGRLQLRGTMAGRSPFAAVQQAPNVEKSLDSMDEGSMPDTRAMLLRSDTLQQRRWGKAGQWVCCWV